MKKLRLNSENLWDFYRQVANIRRPSGGETEIRDFCITFFKQHGIKTEVDAKGNLLARVPASKGFEDVSVLIIQNHMDMVEFEKDGFDFGIDKINWYIEDGWAKTDGRSTAGFDNALGFCAAMLCAIDTELVHGPLEILITVEEETGLFGVNEIDFPLYGKYLFNLDSEEFGIIYNGCQGGGQVLAKTNLFSEPIQEDEYKSFELIVSGLTGGHSGSDIHKGGANAIQILVRILSSFEHLLLFNITAGDAHNVIPSEGKAVFSIRKAHVDNLLSDVTKWRHHFESIYGLTDPTLSISHQEINNPNLVFSRFDTKRVLECLMALPHGIIRLVPNNLSLTETSANLAVVRTEGNSVTILTSQRSFVEREREGATDKVIAIFSLADMESNLMSSYPAWEAIDTPLLTTTLKVGKKLGFEFQKAAMQAGLEVGVLLNKYPTIEAGVSFGPTILGAHSGRERTDLKSVEDFCLLLKALVQNIALKQL